MNHYIGLDVSLNDNLDLHSATPAKSRNCCTIKSSLTKQKTRCIPF